MVTLYSLFIKFYLPSIATVLKLRIIRGTFISNDSNVESVNLDHSVSHMRKTSSILEFINSMLFTSRTINNSLLIRRFNSSCEMPGDRPGQIPSIIVKFKTKNTIKKAIKRITSKKKQKKSKQRLSV